jgi:transcriptional regulator with XRE-family HTH domain
MAGSVGPIINGDVLLRARMRKGLTLRDVAQQCRDLGQDVDFSTLARWEMGGVQVRVPRVLPVLGQVLGLSVDDMFAHGNGKGGAA